ncbi:hypothetical protein DSCO28_01770 [Desulfosarcina ovata subsp. sediminis]|uniref:Uncharacterized protein n=1 Tax=Desulfosarcina ovata subsp. sediminis TaxID=885957 RepID=A0A5K7ZFB1_9BACT|nr:hypothetical protein [Desulfosarcina ovata]BBO79611.1 hypothetical protein DSCO28_01770 [Desulfosarcina ovata subsp. sediminis]
MKFQGALITEQGITFAVVVVKKPFLQNTLTSNKKREEYQQIFPGIPIILAAKEGRGIFQFQGRKDLVNLLASIDSSRIPWKDYSVS